MRKRDRPCELSPLLDFLLAWAMLIVPVALLLLLVHYTS